MEGRKEGKSERETEGLGEGGTKEVVDEVGCGCSVVFLHDIHTVPTLYPVACHRRKININQCISEGKRKVQRLFCLV